VKGFEYPLQPHARKHGPAGYVTYDSYKDWLRDEFLFRCVYCLHRERWYGRAGTFHIDHFVPVSVDAAGTCSYDNLLYACTTCNEAKRAIGGLADPCEVSFASCLRIRNDGHVVALNGAGEKLIQVLLLNSRSNYDHRSLLMRTLAALRKTRPAIYRNWLTFPDDLPDLRHKRAPANTRPVGILSCHFALREQGALPSTY
jgi:HNH endonuclease